MGTMRVLLVLLLAGAIGCSGGGGEVEEADGAPDEGLAPGGPTEQVGDMKVVSRQVIANRTLVVGGKLTIASGGELVLENASLRFAPRVEDEDVVVIEGTGRLVATSSRLDSATGRQWNLVATGTSAVLLDRTVVTGHSGLRFFGSSTFSASGDADVEEVQVHDSATVSAFNGAGVYVVLFFGAGVRATLPAGALVSGPSLTRTIDIPTSLATTGRVVLQNATVDGWQLDLEGDAQLAIEGGDAIVLALHLEDTALTVTDAITGPQPTSGTLDFSASNGPRFAWTSTRIDSVNVYAEGACALTFTGATLVNEPSAGDLSRLVFGPSTAHAANLAIAYDSADVTFDHVRLIEEEEVAPSFTARDNAVLRLDGVAATPRTRATAEGGGQVRISGGSGWTADKLDAVDVTGSGGIFVDGARVKP